MRATEKAVDFVGSIAICTYGAISEDADDDPGVQCCGSVQQSQEHDIYGTLQRNRFRRFVLVVALSPLLVGKAIVC
jgi:hypothetical protein